MFIPRFENVFGITNQLTPSILTRFGSVPPVAFCTLKLPFVLYQQPVTFTILTILYVMGSGWFIVTGNPLFATLTQPSESITLM